MKTDTMELRLNLSYRQILKLIHQLSDKDKEKLASTLQSELSAKKPATKNKIQDIILKAPTWTDEQFADYKDVRNYFNNSRLI